MKKHHSHLKIKKTTLVAGTAVLSALVPSAQAQSSGDALINKLEQKGILSADEAKQLRAEDQQDFSTNFDKSFSSRISMPDWVTGYKLSGDFRGRFDDQSADTPFTAGHNNNVRLRYRLRVGLVVNMKDNLQAGFRLGTDDTGKGSDSTTGNPLSNNSTLLGNGSKKPVWIDAAYGKWTPVQNDTWIVSGTMGKMDNPFTASSMVFDPDYTPEGAALQSSYMLDNKNTILANGAVFVIDQFNSRGPFMYGGQVIWNSIWTPHVSTSAGIAGYNLADQSGIGLVNPGTATPYDSNLGNSIAGGTFAEHFNPIVASGSVTYTLDSFPLYAGAFPIKLGGEYMNNPAAGNKNQGEWVGVTFGKSGKRGTWDLTYRYQYLQANAWWDQVVDDDNQALFATSATAGTVVGGTNIKGGLVKANYSITDSLTFTFACFMNTVIDKGVAGAVAPAGAGLKSDAIHAFADLMWKF